jgi:hypothetical protein
MFVFVLAEDFPGGVSDSPGGCNLQNLQTEETFRLNSYPPVIVITFHVNTAGKKVWFSDKRTSALALSKPFCAVKSVN